MRLTPKQIDMLILIAKGNADGTLIDLDQLMERAAHQPTKASLQFSVRAMIASGLIEKAGTEKRRDRRRVLFKATALGQHYVGPRSLIAAALVSPVVSDADDLGL